VRRHRRTALWPGGHQAAVPQTGEVLGDRGLREADVGGQVRHAVFAEREVAQDGEARWVGESLEEAGCRVQWLDLVSPAISCRNRCHRHTAMITPGMGPSQSASANVRSCRCPAHAHADVLAYNGMETVLAARSPDRHPEPWRCEALMKTRTWLLALGLLVVASIGGALALHHQKAREAADRGMLTPSEYDKAVVIARSTKAAEHGTVIAAVAYVIAGKVRNPNIPGECSSGHVLVVSLVGDFPGVNVSPPPGAPTGPDMWVSVKADPATGETCLEGVSLGRFKAVAGAANLLPAL
jgi:hypothetical protein